MPGWELRPTTRFRKDVRVMKKRGYNLKKLEAAMRLLQETGELPVRYRPHPLRGELAGCLDAHIEPDWRGRKPLPAGDAIPCRNIS